MLSDYISLCTPVSVGSTTSEPSTPTCTNNEHGIDQALALHTLTYRLVSDFVTSRSDPQGAAGKDSQPPDPFHGRRTGRPARIATTGNDDTPCLLV